MRLPIRLRIALYSSLLAALTILFFGVVLDRLAEPGAYQQLDQELARRAHQTPVGAPGDPTDLLHSPDPFLEILAADGHPAGTTGVVDGAPPPVPPDLFRAAAEGHPGYRTIDVAPKRAVRLYALRRDDLPPALGPFAVVVAGQPLQAVEQNVGGLRFFIFLTTVLTLAGAFVASWFVAGRALRPLRAMAATVERIGADRDLSRRLPESAVHDEVGRLGTSFNTMLMRLEAAYENLQLALDAQRRFVADASHELRTPLTTIRGNAELLLRHDRVKDADRHAALRDIAIESERLSRIADQLLTLARAEAGQPPTAKPVELEAILNEAVRRARLAHPERSIQLESEPVRLPGNHDELRQVADILLDNALKHGAGAVRVGLSRKDGWAQLEVSDEGPGLPVGDEERVFERFYQADRARAAGGAGLGLSIARRLIEGRGGRIRAGNRPEGGALFTVELPLSHQSHQSVMGGSSPPATVGFMQATSLYEDTRRVAFVLLVLQSGFAVVAGAGAYFVGVLLFRGPAVLAALTMLGAGVLVLLAAGVARRWRWARASVLAFEVVSVLWFGVRLVLLPRVTFTFLDVVVGLLMPAAVIWAVLRLRA